VTGEAYLWGVLAVAAGVGYNLGLVVRKSAVGRDPVRFLISSSSSSHLAAIG
jgi:hypothetical protein